jgi:hypothetical protein
MIPLQYGYLIGDVSLLVVWLFFYCYRKDTRREMLIMSVVVGVVGFASLYYWWTQDWWHPLTITGTRVGVEDFLVGFASGGIMAVSYEVISGKRLYKRSKQQHRSGGLTVLFALAFFMSWLFWGLHLTSFYSCVVSMSISALLLYYLRKDLFINSVMSGLLMLIFCLPFYYSIILLVPEWIQATYDWEHLSKILIAGIPIEELVFWFYAGLVFGPFYEYWVGARLRLSAKRF